MLNKFRNNDKGFTLVELMMVIVILGVLAGVAIPMVSRMRENAMIAKMGSYADSLATAIIMDTLTRGEFPDTDAAADLISFSGDDNAPSIKVNEAIGANGPDDNLLNVVHVATEDSFTINGYLEGDITPVVTKSFDLVEAVD